MLLSLCSPNIYTFGINFYYLNYSHLLFLICCCYLFSSFLSWGNCMGSCWGPTILFHQILSHLSPRFLVHTMLNCTRLRKRGVRCDRYIKCEWKVGMPPKVWSSACLCLYVPNISSTWPICMIPSMLVSLMAL